MKNRKNTVLNYSVTSAPIFKSNIDASKLFEMAIEFANTGYKLKAMETAREALIFAKQANDYVAVYIHSFLAVIHMDFKNFSNARIHCYNANNRLDKTHFSFNTDKIYIDALLKKIAYFDRDAKQLEFDALAA